MKTRVREKIQPINVVAGDEIHLTFSEGVIPPIGKGFHREREVLTSKIDRSLTVNEAVIFDVEEGDFEGVKDGIGGAFLSCKRSK